MQKVEDKKSVLLEEEQVVFVKMVISSLISRDSFMKIEAFAKFIFEPIS